MKIKENVAKITGDLLIKMGKQGVLKSNYLWLYEIKVPHELQESLRKKNEGKNYY